MNMWFIENEFGRFVITAHDGGELEIHPLADLHTLQHKFSHRPPSFIPEYDVDFDPQETAEWSDAFFLHEMRIRPW